MYSAVISGGVAFHPSWSFIRLDDYSFSTAVKRRIATGMIKETSRLNVTVQRTGHSGIISGVSYTADAAFATLILSQCRAETDKIWSVSGLDFYLRV